MNIYTELEDRLWQICSVAKTRFPDTPVIFSHSMGEEPAESYILISTLSVEQEGGGVSPTLLNRGGKLDVRAVYTALVQISFYGSKAGNIAHDFIHMINSPMVKEAMSSRNVAILSKTSLRRNPQRRETKWVESFNFDVRFNYIINTPLDIDYVETAVIDYKINRG